MIVLDQSLSMAPDINWAETDGEILVIELNQGHVFSLNEAGSRIWRYLLEGLSANQIVERLRSAFEADLSTIQADTVEFVEFLLEKNLMRYAEQPIAY